MLNVTYYKTKYKKGDLVLLDAEPDDLGQVIIEILDWDIATEEYQYRFVKHYDIVYVNQITWYNIYEVDATSRLWSIQKYHKIWSELNA